jgi:hypothetical protein
MKSSVLVVKLNVAAIVRVLVHAAPQTLVDDHAGSEAQCEEKTTQTLYR